jgi:predicted amidophosphoribosyltransferase
MREFHIEANQYLFQCVKAFYHIDYVGYKKPDNPDYINIIKNTFGRVSNADLQAAVDEFKKVIYPDFQQIQSSTDTTLTVCVVPRAKEENSYKPDQKLFRTTVRDVGLHVGFLDGTSYIIRKIDTKTTHLAKAGIANDGNMPYPGITKQTCILSQDIIDRDILLVDDIYTKTVNIDEDAIQALFDCGARSVIFYAVARTKFKYD